MGSEPNLSTADLSTADLSTADLSTADLVGLVGRVAVMSPAVDDAERIDRIGLFESLKSAISAAQAAEAVQFDRSQRAVQAAAGVPVERLGRGVAQQVALARRVSPWQGQRWLGWATIMTAELPVTFAELAAGRTSEWRAMLVARETAVLSRADRAEVDAQLAPHLHEWGDRRVEAEARTAAYRLDPAAAVARARKAEADRRVGLRPAPDTMCWLSALLPVAQGVATYAALRHAADGCTAGGDERGRGQIMADTLVERVTGQATADAVPVEIVLVIAEETLLGDPTPNATEPKTGQTKSGEPKSGETKSGERKSGEPKSGDRKSGDRRCDGVQDDDVAASGARVEDGQSDDTWFDAGDPDVGDPDADRAGAEPDVEPARGPRPGRRSEEPAWLQDYGPVPAAWARELAYGCGDTAPAGPRWLRRLYTRRGRPVELESTRRLFTPGQQRFLRLRDQTCRTPWCNAPIRHADHIDPYDDGGPTHTDNGQGLCEACNYAKEALNWISTVDLDGTVTIRTPTGHEYTSPQTAIFGPPSQPPDSATG